MSAAATISSAVVESADEDVVLLAQRPDAGSADRSRGRGSDVPQFRCVSIVERYAASVPATTRPRNPAGRKRIIAGYAMSCPSSDGSTCGNGAGDVGELRVDDRRRERDDDPRPRTQRVVHDVEQQRADDGVLLGLRREHALRDVAAAARLGARIPHRPPLDGERNDEHGRARCSSRRSRAGG